MPNTPDASRKPLPARTIARLEELKAGNPAGVDDTTVIKEALRVYRAIHELDAEEVLGEKLLNVIDANLRDINQTISEAEQLLKKEE